MSGWKTLAFRKKASLISVDVASGVISKTSYKSLASIDELGFLKEETITEYTLL